MKFSDWAGDRGASGAPEEPGTWEDGLAELAAGKGQPAAAAPAPWDRDLSRPAPATRSPLLSRQNAPGGMMDYNVS